MPGLDRKTIASINFDKAVERILADVGSDFIYAPYLNFVYQFARKELIADVKSKLASGTFEFFQPITINVPKKTRLCRPGSILAPQDRLLYQALTDSIAKEVESNLNRESVFSHVLAPDQPSMFEESSEAYHKFQQFISAKVDSFDYAIRTDVSAYFETINQHTLVNSLRNFRISSELANLLEVALSKWNELSSRGILQGMFPSDLLGNFYLSILDHSLEIEDIVYCRYVDDIVIFQYSKNECLKTLELVCDILRRLSLTLNDQKTYILKSKRVLHQETEFDALFLEVKQKLINDLFDERQSFKMTYGFQDDWDEYEEFIYQIEKEDGFNNEILESLYDKRDNAQWQRDNIIKYCIPLFLHFQSDYPIESINKEILDHPYLTKIFARYYSSFQRENQRITHLLEEIINSGDLIYDYQYLWLFSALLYRKTSMKKTIVRAIRILKDRNRHEALRAICSMIVAKFGDGNQKKMLRDVYSSESSVYVKASILFATQYFPSAEKSACRKAWKGHSELNVLIVKGFENQSALKKK
ncbi:reverse transcriptase domain-containing protein [Leptospira santarosai]|uniref:reverse transcriptase domain-containing protein n=1 Tax=Leptospira santarosai TaxID=28183 RepID=UPI0024AE9334|nr:reverse transcriptase domain-containing protein [Leptospira santarosai]MDI7230450.1 reverse transcriptase domain-containing protein [Leptospira santarosai]